MGSINEMYRISGMDCENCKDLTQIIHTFEMHDLDVKDVKRSAIKGLAKYGMAGFFLAMFCMSVGMIGLGLFSALPGAYGWIAMFSLYVFGSYMLVISIMHLAMYLNDRERVAGRLSALIDLRRMEIKRRQERDK